VRGENIVNAGNALGKWADEQARTFYAAADAAAGQSGLIPATRFETTLANPTLRAQILAKQGGSAMLDQVSNLFERYQKEGIVTTDGVNLGPSTARSAEGLRKWLNAIEDRNNAPLVVRLKQALDEDVATVAGQDFYKQARDFWKSPRCRCLTTVSSPIQYDQQVFHSGKWYFKLNPSTPEYSGTLFTSHDS
jgi:hypothetical protein